MMKTPLFLSLTLACAVVCAAQTESKCFRSDWLQGERSVNLTIDGAKVSGTFVVGSADDAETKTYPFSGRRSGRVLAVVFAGDKRPDVSPAELRSLVWTLIKRGKRELLRIKVFGKNYETNKYADRFVYFEPCELSHD